MLKLIVVLFLFATQLRAAQQQLTALFANGKERVVASKEFFFTPRQEKAINRDLPIRDLALTTDRLWLLGKKFVWSFDLKEQRLRKYDFYLSKEFISNAFLSKDKEGRTAYLASPQTLFRMQGKPKLLKYFDKKFASTVDFASLSGNFVWLTTQGVYFYNLDTDNMNYFPYQIQMTDKVVISPSLEFIWLLRGKDLVQVSRSGGQSIKIVTASDMELDSDKKSLFVKRGNTVLRYSYTGELTQVIPVTEGRKLLSMYISPSAHSYIFEDGLFEHYRMKEKEVLVTALRLSPRARVTNLDVFASRLAFLDSGKVRIFVLKKTPADLVAK